MKALAALVFVVVVIQDSYGASPKDSDSIKTNKDITSAGVNVEWIERFRGQLRKNNASTVTSDSIPSLQTASPYLKPHTLINYSGLAPAYCNLYKLPIGFDDAVEEESTEPLSPISTIPVRRFHWGQQKETQNDVNHFPTGSVSFEESGPIASIVSTLPQFKMRNTIADAYVEVSGIIPYTTSDKSKFEPFKQINATAFLKTNTMLTSEREMRSHFIFESSSNLEQSKTTTGKQTPSTNWMARGEFEVYRSARGSDEPAVSAYIEHSKSKNVGKVDLHAITTQQTRAGVSINDIPVPIGDSTGSASFFVEGYKNRKDFSRQDTLINYFHSNKSSGVGVGTQWQLPLQNSDSMLEVRFGASREHLDMEPCHSGPKQVGNISLGISLLPRPRPRSVLNM